MRWPVVAFAAVLALAIPGIAEAKERYASPAGSGTECTTGKPCSLQEAVTKAKTADEVIILAGTYMVMSNLYVPSGSVNVFVHGAFGGPMPRIEAKVPIAPVSFNDAAGRLAYLEIVNEGVNAYGVKCFGGGTVERVRALAKGAAAVGLEMGPGCVVKDSLVRAEGDFPRGLRAASGGFADSFSTVRNVTVIASGSNALGVESTYTELAPGGSMTLDLRNAIVSGSKYDLQASAAMGAGKIIVGHSNYDSSYASSSASTITDASGNQSAAPLFVDPAAGDYREAAGSPTIDAGVVDQLGTTDLEGKARVIGAAPDIGAFEFVPPVIDSPTQPTAQTIVGKLESVSVAPRKFRPLKAGEAVASAGKKVARGTTVTYRVSVSNTVDFRVERKLSGRRVKGKCVMRTRANASDKPCPLFKPLKGAFSHLGAAGENRFTFSGRVGGKALKAGAYRLLGSAGGTSLSALFRVVE